MNVEQFYKIYLKSAKLQIDSRKVKKNDIFFAFTTDKFNAASLAGEVKLAGALAAIVEDRQFEDAENFIFYVESTLLFLQNLASYHRQQLTIPIIGITGSNGKTTTKELLHTVLSSQYNVLCTIGNLNNHIGVPLTLLSIQSQHEIAIVEMGANHQKEIETLCNIAKPTLGYITNFGKAHLEGFGGVDGVIKGKSELYDFLKSSGGIILVNDNDEIQVTKTENYKEKITFGKDTSDYNFSILNHNNFVGLISDGENIQSHLTGAYNFSNISAAVALGLYFKIEFKSICLAIENYEPINMRSQIVVRNGVTLVLDTYNANPSSMAASLQNFANFEGTKTIIIGDMLELGNESIKEHKKMLALASRLNFTSVITVGQIFYEANEITTKFKSTAELVDYLKTYKIGSDNILLKASRGITLETIIDYL